MYHWQFLGLAGVSLAVSYYLTYRKRTRRGITLNKLILWAATLVLFLNLFLPVLVGHLMS